MTPPHDAAPATDAALTTTVSMQRQLTPSQNNAVIAVFEGFYKALAGQINSGVQVNVWQGPKPIIVDQLNTTPLPPQVAQSIINMLVAILRAKPEPYARILAEDGALEALYDIAFAHAPRLDQLMFDRLSPRSAGAVAATAMQRCCLTSEPLGALVEPVMISGEHTTHLFDFEALKAMWRESFRFINPMTRQQVDPATLFRVTP